MAEDLDTRIARKLLAEYENGEPFHILEGSDRPLELVHAYRVQRRFRELFCETHDDRIAGYKIALTSAAMQEMVGIDQPLYGAIFASRVHQSPVQLDLRSFQHLGIECELAVRTGTALTPAEAPFDRAKIAKAVASIAPAFELIEDRNADYRHLDAESLVADNCWNAGIVLGPETSDWRGISLVESVGVLERNRRAAARGRLGEALGHPFDALAWLANAMAANGETLDAGMICMTGSVVRTVFPSAGDLLEFKVFRLGSAALTMTR